MAEVREMANRLGEDSAVESSAQTGVVVEKKVSVAIFSGGRGTTSICEAFLNHPRIDLRVIVNTYDDGLSTGMLRRFVPGMLGPSDVRKSISRLMAKPDQSIQSLKTILEYRLPKSIDYFAGVELIGQMIQRQFALDDHVLAKHIPRLSLAQFETARQYLMAFNAYLEVTGGVISAAEKFSFSDCSVGNILFAGCFLASGRNFNRTVEEFSKFAELPQTVFNITDGSNLVLVGVKSDGALLRNESEIVSAQSATPLEEVFLLNDYLSEAELEEVLPLPLQDKLNWLRVRSAVPPINPEVDLILRSADMIIYGPGTQHSSLMPSYLTAGVAEAIAANPGADKIFIANIHKDYEIQSETANTLVGKLLWYLSRKGQAEFPHGDLVSRYFFQVPEEIEGLRSTKYLKFFAGEFTYGLDRVVAVNWEAGPGAHLGGRVVDELIAVANTRLAQKLESYRYMVSIIAPGLNEERTVRRVLHDIALLNFDKLGLGKEIIFVDGGSTDSTYQESLAEPQARSYRPGGLKGRGDALRYGISRAKGDIIAFFPTDGEYDASDILPLVRAIVSNEYRVAFGSRAIKCVDLSDRIKGIYRGNYLGYLMSKYGGMALSILGLVLYNRFISDPLTSLKVFDARLLRELNLNAHGVDLETELIAKLGVRREYIVELPVEYRPRTKLEGKKTTVGGGLKALLRLVTTRFRYPFQPVSQTENRYAKAINSNTGL